SVLGLPSRTRCSASLPFSSFTASGGILAVDRKRPPCTRGTIRGFLEWLPANIWFTSETVSLDAQDSRNTSFVEPAKRVVSVLSKRCNPLKARLLIQGNGGVLMDASLQPQCSDAFAPGIVNQMVQHQLRETQATKLGTHVQPLYI